MVAAGVAGALMIAACGGSIDDAEPDSTTDEATESTDDADDTSPDTTTADTEAPEAVGFDGIQPSVIQIEALGTLRDPEIGFTDGSGRGSGFIISPDGIAVTNNHVVTGAATLEVFIGGDTSDSFNATILGVSECLDLAVIDIDEDDPLPPLQWYEGDVTTGTDVYAAGFPLGETEYTLTRGIVSKLEADGDTSWASLDSVLEHDANIQPGNSGGPLVAEDGTVIGINYKGRDITNTTQFYAIDKDTAQEAVELLMEGDFESIGVNGEAIVDEEQEIAGIWVAGVAPGSPADDVELLPGDIIQSMNGLPVGTDGTMADYCDVLRTAGDRPIRIEVLRFDTSEILSGEINGDKPLEQTFSFAEAIEEETDIEETAEGEEAITGYVSLVDDTGQISIDVPTEWSDVDTSPLVLDDGTELPFIIASPSIQGFNDTYDTPGLFYGVLTQPTGDVSGTLASFAPTDTTCVDGGVTPYEDAVFTGEYQIWTGCGGSESIGVVLVASPIDGSGYQAVIGAQVVSEADLDALDQAFATFNVL